MKLFGVRINSKFLFLPAVGMLFVLAFFAIRLIEDVRASLVFICLYLIFGLLGVGLFWLYHDTEIDTQQALASRSSPSMRRGTTFLFFLSISGAVIALKTQSPGAVRPTSYYLFVSLATGFVGLRSVLITEQRRDQFWVIAQIILLALVIRFALVYLQPIPYVSDTQFHWQIIMDTIESGKFQGRGPYEVYPIFHVFNAAFFQLAVEASAPSWLFPVLNNLIIAITVIVFYLLGRLAFDNRIGLLAATLATTSNFFFLSAMYKTNWVGMTLMLFGILFILQLTDQKDVRLIVPFWGVAIATLLIHPVVFMTLILTMAGAYLAAQQPREIRPFGAQIPLFSLTTIFGVYILYVHQRLFIDLISATVGIDQATSSDRLGLTVNIADVPLASSYTLDMIVNFTGPALLTMFIVPGAFYCARNRDYVKNALALMIGILYVFIFVVIVAERGESLSITRTLVFVSPLSAIVAAAGLGHITSNLNMPTRSTIVLVFIVLLTVFSSISYTSNFNGEFAKNPVHYQLTAEPATLASHDFIQMIPNGSSITGDKYNTQYVATTLPPRGLYALPAESYTVRLYYTLNWTESDYFLLDPNSLTNYHSFTGPSYIGLGEELARNHSRVYSSGFEIYHQRS